MKYTFTNTKEIKEACEDLLPKEESFVRWYYAFEGPMRIISVNKNTMELSRWTPMLTENDVKLVRG